MDFSVTTTDGENAETKHFEQFHDMIAYISSKAAAWNNFNPDEPFKIILKKVPNGTDTLGVVVEDNIDIADLFGGRP